MLRALVLALLLANAVYLVWTQGLLTVYGFGPASQAEPERQAQQIQPESMQLLEVKPARPPAQTTPNTTTPPAANIAVHNNTAPVVVPASAPVAVPASAPVTAPAPAPVAVPAPAPVAAPASAPVAAPAPAPVAVPAPVAAPAPAAVPALVPIATLAPAPPQCLQAGPFTERQVNALRPRLQASLPAGSWSFASTGEPVRWTVYMGKYISKEAMNKKRILLEQAGVPFKIPTNPLLRPGLSLGSFKSKAEAEAALAKLAERGIRSAKVMAERPDTPTHLLKLPAVNTAMQAKVKKSIPLLSGKRLQACR